MSREKPITKFEIGLILKDLATYGVKRILVRYSGGGDSGEIDEVEAVFEEKKVRRKVKGRYKMVIAKNPEIPNWSGIEDKIKEWTYDRLTHEDDWCNNEGGEGNIKIEVPTGKYKLNHGVHVMHTEYSASDGSLKKELADF